MKLTLSWLKEYLHTDASLEKICKTLTRIGLEVESVEDKAQSLAPFYVAQIIEAKPHENSTKLQICSVQTTEPNPIQVICGAANARSGLKVAFAPIGSTIPANGLVIKKAKIAGVESSGMLCSARELGLGNEDAGIIEIDEKWQIGAKISEVFSQNDAIIEINVTPNRGDCLGIYNIARDLAAAGLGTLNHPQIAKTKSQFALPISLKNEAPEICSRAAFRYIKNVKNCESPKWLKDQLSALGMNSISAIVDVTNYVMLAFNRPMHAYDASKINGALTIRLAKNDEKFISLKNDEFTLDEKVLVIADDKKALGIAGIIGSNNSGCDAQTSEILLEAAFFDAENIARTGRKLSILSDARHRFERGVDANSCELGIDLATKLIIEICGGEVSEVDVLGKAETAKKIKFNLDKIKKLTGVEVAPTQAAEILEKLGFLLQKQIDGKLIVEVPSHRHDIFASEDLVEEVVRIFGYDKIGKTPLPIFAEKKETNILHKVRTNLASQGFIETISWSFVDENLVEIFDEKNPKLTLANPISSELNHMRPSLAIGLLESYKKNVARNFSNLSLFEIGNVFVQDAQKLVISGLRAGKNKEENHYGDARNFDIFDVKKDFSEVIETFGLRFESLQLSTANAPRYYHPHRFAELRLGKNLVGFFGEVHPAIAKKFDLKNRVNLFEIFVDALPNQQKSGARKAYIQNDLQLVERDFAFVVDKTQAVGDIIKTIANTDKQLIKEVSIFDIFNGKNLEEGKKSIAFKVLIQPIEKTLTSDEIEAISKKIIDAVSNVHKASLRS
jgi:phenylalanyl-tRNA synthetase beta chain